VVHDPPPKGTPIDRQAIPVFRDVTTLPLSVHAQLQQLRSVRKTYAVRNSIFAVSLEIRGPFLFRFQVRHYSMITEEEGGLHICHGCAWSSRRGWRGMRPGELVSTIPQTLSKMDVNVRF
jgi:hypothetical protein